MNNFNNAHEQRKRQRRNRQNVASNPPPQPANPPNAPLPQPPPVQPDYDQFNAQFHHHFQNQAQQMEDQHIHRVREEMMQREAQEAHRQQQLQQQLLQQQERQARQQQLQQELLQRQAEEAHHQQQLQQQLLQKQAEEAHHQEQLQQQLLQRQAEEAHHWQQLQDAILQRQEAQEIERQQAEQRRPYREPVTLHYLGAFTVKCLKCHALHFLAEKLSKSSQRNPFFGMCCLQGKVSLPRQQRWPNELNKLYNAPQFVTNIRQYNCATSFTSVGVKMDGRALQNSGPHAFEIHGALHHNIGDLMPPEATNVCATRNPNLNPAFLRTIHDILWNYHPFAQLNKQAYQVMREKPPEEHPHVFVRIHFQEGTDGRRYNLPAANEIAAVIPGDGSEDVSDNRDIILRLQGGQLQCISHLSPFYATLHYVLLFPRSEEGWHLDIPLQIDEDGRARSKKVTQLLYYAYHLHIRPSDIEPPNIFRAGRLFQQYGVDAWASIEQSNLNWIRNNQKKDQGRLLQGLD
ncbi:hypothetical protein K503DRAFT_703857 [Rhizopogon vinicolor AM-OR11-026]|uniref:Helitron helicase-like domain-containing protein n=1 Tax=Rhizopogon vinicolor AM-OR11-026 TaxID=1314800 RepID=A0A1B7MFG0_9AGAM|nr:hypothetical protein K503DRAFT_703857 [Rhizopogon vinicolor AM-OR11-026]